MKSDDKNQTLRMYFYVQYLGKLQIGDVETLYSVLRELERCTGQLISKRTFQRDKRNLEKSYGIYIEYSRKEKGFYLDKDVSDDFENLLKFFEVLTTAEMLKDSFQNRKIPDVRTVSMGAIKGLRGVAFLKELYESVVTEKMISFSYKSFSSANEKKYKVKPYMLKEYEGRWYVVGVPVGSEGLKTFGVDRITALSTTDEIFDKEDSIDVLDEFKNIIGVNYKGDKKEEVVLSFNRQQGDYIKTLPLHASQQILIDSEDELKVKLELIVNLELKQKVLMYGASVKVLEPEFFRDEVKDELLKGYQNY